jgi:hypothetical protein
MKPARVGVATPENRCKAAKPKVGSAGPHGVRSPLSPPVNWLECFALVGRGAPYCHVTAATAEHPENPVVRSVSPGPRRAPVPGCLSDGSRPRGHRSRLVDPLVTHPRLQPPGGSPRTAPRGFRTCAGACASASAVAAPGGRSGGSLRFAWPSVFCEPSRLWTTNPSRTTSSRRGACASVLVIGIVRRV